MCNIVLFVASNVFAPVPFDHTAACTNGILLLYGSLSAGLINQFS